VTDALRTASEVALQLLVIATAVSIPLLLLRSWRIARRFQLVVGELVNSTPDPDLDRVTRGLTQLARQRIDAEVRVVARRRESLHQALGGARSSRTTERVQERLDDSLGELVSVAREVAPAPARPVIGVFGVLVARPRGLVVTGIIQSRGRSEAARLGFSLDVLQADGHRSLSSQTFWEPDASADDERSATERLIALLGPAARWVAIRLVVQSVFPGRVRREERGLDHLLGGVLYAQSADAFADHAAVFRRRAADELEQAAEQLPDAPLPLAALADTLDRLAAGSPSLYTDAHAQYARALAAMTAQRPPPDDLIETYRVRQATSWLASGHEQPRRRALAWLAAERPRADAGERPADELYDAACLYALAAAEDPAFRAPALELLGRALAGERSLRQQALRDPQLAGLGDELAGLVRTLEGELEPAGVSRRARRG